MERVVGIGGTFFRARDAEQLRVWYAEHLGFDVQDWGGEALFAKDGDQTVWSISAGVDVDDKTSEDENGRFGWATDPEGNRFELWQPRH